MKRRDFVAAAAAVIAAPKAMSQVPSSPLLCLGSTCRSGQITNGSAFTVTGSGFGTKSASAPTVYDNCQGTNLTNLWSRNHTAPYGDPNDPWAEQYHLPTDLTPNGDPWSQTGANLIGPATPLRSKYICSALESTVGGYGSGNLMFGLTLPTVAPPYYVVCSWYEAYPPNWVFNTPYSGAANDNNFKWIVYTTALTGGYGTKYWYMEYGNSEFNSVTSTPTLDINDDGAGIVGRLKNSPGGEWHSPQVPNKFYTGINGWVKKELAMYLSSGTDGFISMVISQPRSQPRWNGYLWNSVVGAGTTDPYGGIGRTLWLGGFRRDFPQAVNRQYWSDIYLDVQTTGVGRFALTDTNSLSTATCIEYQPYTLWAPTSVTLTCQKGNLASGTVYLWYLDEIHGNQLLGTYTMS